MSSELEWDNRNQHMDNIQPYDQPQKDSYVEDFGIPNRRNENDREQNFANQRTRSNNLMPVNNRDKSPYNRNKNDNLRDKSRSELQRAEKDFIMAQNVNELDEILNKKTITLQEFDEHVLSRLNAWDSSKNRKIAKLRKQVIEELERNCTHIPTNECKSYRNFKREPLVNRIQSILDDHGTRITKERQKQEESRIVDEMSHCTFTPRTNRNPKEFQTNKSVSKIKANTDDLLKWGEEKNKKIESRRLQEHEMAGYKFKPEISKKSKQIVKSGGVDVFDRQNNQPKKKHENIFEEKQDFKPKINTKSKLMAERKKEKVREENIVKNLEAMSNNKQQATPVKIQDQVSRNNANDMERKFQEIFDKAHDKMNNEYKIEDGDEDQELPNYVQPMRHTNDGSMDTSGKDMSYIDNNSRDIQQIENELRNLQSDREFKGNKDKSRRNFEDVSRSRSKESSPQTK